MTAIGFHYQDLLIGCPLLLFAVIPWIVGFTWILPDANRRGQPGLLWAVLTVPLGWLAVLGYLIARAVQRP